MDEEDEERFNLKDMEDGGYVKHVRSQEGSQCRLLRQQFSNLFLECTRDLIVLRLKQTAFEKYNAKALEQAFLCAAKLIRKDTGLLIAMAKSSFRKAVITQKSSVCQSKSWTRLPRPTWIPCTIFCVCAKVFFDGSGVLVGTDGSRTV